MQNRLDILFDLFDHFAPIYNYDWLDMRKSLQWIKRYRFAIYEKYEAQLKAMIDKLAPRSFKKQVNVAREENDERDFGTDDHFQSYINRMLPFAERFVNERIWLTPDFADMADDRDFIGMWLAYSISNKAEEAGVREELYKGIETYILNKPTDYQSSFILQIVTHDLKLELLEQLKETLLQKGYYQMASCMMGRLDNDSLIQFDKLLTLVENGTIEPALLKNHFNHYCYSTVDNVLKINDKLYASPAIDKGFAIQHLEMYGFFMRSEITEEQRDNIKRKIMDYPFDEEHLKNGDALTYLIEKFLKKTDSPDLAISINNSLTDLLSKELCLHNHYIERLYFALLPKYGRNIIPDILAAMADKETGLIYSYNTKNILGSGLSTGRGPLFQCGTDLIKDACSANPSTMPERIAEMCPIYKYDGDKQLNEFDDLPQWLIDNYGDNEDVLSALGSNFGTFSYIGNELSEFYKYRRDIFKTLFNHQNPTVADWAKKMYDCETSLMNREKYTEDYRKMLYR